MARTITLTFEDGSSHVYNNVPDDVTPEQVAQRAAQEFQGRALINIDGGKKPNKMSFGEGIPVGFAGAGNLADTLLTGVRSFGASLSQIPGFGTPATIEDQDALFRGQQERAKKRMQWANPNEKEMSIPGAFGAALGGLPGMALAPASGIERTQQLLDNGESMGRAATAGAIDSALSTAGVLLPAAAPGKLATRLASGAAINPILGGASDLATNLLAEQEKTKKEFDPLDPTRRIPEAVMGATIGGVAGPRPKVKPKTGEPKVDAALEKLRDIVAEEQPPTPKEQMPLDPNRDEALIPAMRRAIEAQRPPEILYSGNDGVARPELSLGKPVNRAKTRPEVPPQLNGEAPKGELLSLLDESQYPQADGGVRPVGRDGTPLRGMAEDVPTIDFPLRQEVLEQPAIKQAIDNFRIEAERLKQAGDQAGLDKLTRDFSAGMQRLGVAKASDTYGRGLYEGGADARYIETGIRRGGENNTNLATMPEVPQLPFGGKALTAGERAGLPKPVNTRTGRPFVPKSQRGSISPDLLGIGRVSDLLGRLGSSGLWEKFKGTFSSREMKIAEALARRPDARSTVVWMAPQDFLDLAKERTTGRSLMSEDQRGSIRAGLKSKNGLNQLPYLMIEDAGNGSAQVIGHEGRHRSDVFMEQGVDLIPVRILGDIRWNKEGNPINQLVGEDGKVRPMPERVFPQEPSTIKPFGNKQGGAIDPDMFGLNKAADAISNAIGRLSKSKLAAGEKKKNAFDRTAAGKAVKDDVMIPSGVTVEAAKAEALATPDIPSTANMLIGGGAMLKMIKDNPVVYATYNWFNSATKYADYNIRKFVKPVEQILNPILQSKTNTKALQGILDLELKNEKQFTKNELLQAGFDERVANAYTEFRSLMDEAHKVQNAALEKAGMKPLTFREHYLASRWEGNWRTPVYAKVRNSDGSLKIGKDGTPEIKLVWWIAETTKRQAKDALDWIAKSDPDIDVAKSTIEYRNTAARSKGSIEAGYYAMLNLLDKNDPRTQALKTVYEDYIAQQGQSTLGQTKHFEQKAGIRGYVGDRPWKENQHAEARLMFRQQMQYAKNAFEWSAMQDAVGKFKELAADPEVGVAQKNALEVSKEYAKNSLGYGDNKVFAMAENGIAELFNISPSVLADIVGYPRAAFYWTKLGFFNIPYTVVSLSQPVFAMPWHRKLTLEGYKHNPLTTMADSFHDASASILREHGVNAKLTDLGERAHKYLMDNGLTDINPLSDVADLGRNSTLQAAEKVITYNMVMSEKAARTQTFMGFVHHLDQSGKFKGKELDMFSMAEDYTNIVMADYRIKENAPLFNKMGITGSALSTLNRFRINQWNQLYKLAKDAKQTGNVSPLMMMMGIQFVLGGATGFFAVNTVDSMWEAIKSEMDDETYADFKDIKIKEGLAQMAFKDPEKSWISHGIVSKLTGINFASRYDAGTVVDPTLEGFLPFVSDLGNQLSKVIASMKAPTDPVAAAQAVEAVAPSSLKGLVQLNMPTKDDKKYNRDAFDTGVKAFGTTSLKEAIQNEVTYRGDQSNAQDLERRRNVAKRIGRIAIVGNPENLGKEIELYTELGGNPKELNEMIPNAAKKMFIPKLDRIKMQAKTYPSIYKYLNYVE